VSERVSYAVTMKRQLTALLLTLALGLQGSSAFAAVTPLMQSDNQTSAESHHASHKCCPTGGLNASCCPDACVASVAIPNSSGLVVGSGRTAPLQFRTTIFFSRGESPLIRPPIL
jgi:hypothetical protein